MSRSTRYGLLIVAMIHIMTAATLSFTHGHIPSDAAGRSVVAATDDGDGGSRPGHTDACVICQTLSSTHVSSVASKTITEPVHAPVGAESDPMTLPSVPTYSSASPRGPPRA